MASQLARAEHPGRRKGHQALRYAKALLSQPDPDLEMSAVVLVEALLDSELSKREQAAGLLAQIGAPGLPPLLNAWQWADGESRQIILVTWGLMGPAAAPVVSLLVPLRDDEMLGAHARSALERIQRTALTGAIQAAKSPWIWSRLLDWLPAVLSHPATICVSFCSTGLSLWHWYVTLSSADRGIPAAVSASFALLGASLGALVALHLGGLARANTVAKFWGTCGSVVGMMTGNFAAALVLPIVRALALR